MNKWTPKCDKIYFYDKKHIGGIHMFIETIIAENLTDENKKKYSNSEKFLAGCQAVCGKPVSEISKKIGMSREYIYDQKVLVENYIKMLDDAKPEVPVIAIDKPFIERTILSLALDCRSPISGIKEYLDTVCGKSVSTGHISSVINEASRRAQIFDKKIDLSGITQGANDEIFQGQSPILTGIDPESTYIYLLGESPSRTADDWQMNLEALIEQGLCLSISINDQAPGLLSGVAKAFPDAEIQPDIFHVISGIGKEVTKIGNKAYTSLNKEYQLWDRLESKNVQQKTIDELERQEPITAELIRVFDNIYILFSWFKELMGFSGYDVQDATHLIEYILSELENQAADYPKLHKETQKTRKILSPLLSFVNRFQTAADAKSQELGIPPEAFWLMYRQRSFKPFSTHSNDIEY
jgi:hypothetical protein